MIVFIKKTGLQVSNPEICSYENMLRFTQESIEVTIEETINQLYIWLIRFDGVLMQHIFTHAQKCV